MAFVLQDYKVETIVHKKTSFTLLSSFLTCFNVPDDNIIRRGRTENNGAAFFPKGHGSDVIVVTC